MIIAGTGHRPYKLGGFAKSGWDLLVEFATLQLQRLRPNEVISGMALGWDQALATAAIKINTPLIAAVPCEGHESRWDEESQRYYHTLLGKARKVVVVSPGAYVAKMMMVRNKWMVDALQSEDLLLALWDGSAGGTARTIVYAESRTIRVENVWDQWREYVCAREKNQ
jgi:uncharacterized phage-like protein YoqJ